MALEVSVVKCEEYKAGDVSKALDESMRLIGGLRKYVKKGDKVLVKPNMLAAHPPQKAVTTHPMVIEQLLRKIKDCGAKPSVGDSPALTPTQHIGEVSGIKAACDRQKVSLIELSQPKWVNNPRGKLVKRFPLSARLDEFDVIVNAPKLKTHAFTTYTGAVKNMFGCIPGRMKGRFHSQYPTKQEFIQMLLDLHKLVKPQLTVMDAVVCMQGLGPSYGAPRYGGYLLASNDSLALDYIATGIIGLRDKMPMFANENLGGIVVHGERQACIPNFKAPFNPSLLTGMRSRAMELLGRWFALHPVVDKNCVGCGDCARACPQHAITMNKTARIDSKKCIRCFCCYEVCPHSAISLKRFF
jgi:uncharacterized protein (DUF362 family)/NAD-dependent dihydropyrimidine dehydrogenase PreA subunit